MKNIIFTILFFIGFLSYGQYGPELIDNGDMSTSTDWNLLNGSSISGGVATVIGNGNLNADFPNWVVQQTNIEYRTKWEHTVYELSFDARQTIGSGNLQVSQRFTYIFDQPVTGTMTTYTIQFNGGSETTAGNDLIFGGASGDQFEIDNVSLKEVLMGPVINFYTDFETDQWGDNGANPPAGNFWEVDHGLPRTTDHIDAAISTGRDGTGRAIWLGAYNGDATRNELGKDDELSANEFWQGFSVYVDNPLDLTRIIMQNRFIANTSNTVNAISLRQGSGQLYFSLPTNLANVDQTSATLGGWNGAGTNTTSHYFDYTPNTWIDIVIHYKGAFGAGYTGPDTSTLTEALGFDPRSDGIIEIWVNGVKLVDHVGTTMYRYDRDGNEIYGTITPKIGPYWSSTTQTGDYYYDEYKLAQGLQADFNAVDPSGSGISAGYTVNPTSSLTTTEAGGTDTFTVVLDSQPTTDVVFDIVSNDTGEGTVSSSSLTFTNANWNTAQTITVTGVDDVIDDGDIAYTVTVSVNAAESDDDYDALADVTVDLTNTDDDGGAEPSPSTGKRVKKGKFILIDY